MRKFGMSYLYKSDEKSVWTVDKFYSVAVDKKTFEDMFYAYLLKAWRVGGFVGISKEPSTVLDSKLEDDRFIIDSMRLGGNTSFSYGILENGVKVIIPRVQEGIPVSMEEVCNSMSNLFTVHRCGFDVPKESEDRVINILP